MDMPLENMKRLLETTVAFVGRTGVKALELEPRRVKLMAPLRGNENHIGTMYTGALFTLAEIPVGALYLTTFDVSKYYPEIKEMTIQFVRPAKTDCDHRSGHIGGGGPTNSGGSGCQRKGGICPFWRRQGQCRRSCCHEHRDFPTAVDRGVTSLRHLEKLKNPVLT